jgi:lipopolysaccharide export system protein LptC
VPAVLPTRQIGRADGTRMFRSAARHSRLVRFLRFAIPAVILIIAAVIVMATFFNPFKLITAVFPIDPGKISVDWSGTKIKMEMPRYTGFGNDRHYELTARGAVQDLTKLEVVELQEIAAKVELKDGQQINLTAISGVYDTKAEVLKLNDHIIIDSSSGYEGRLSEATVHVSTGYIVSESPVEVKLPNGTLNANRLEVKENGAFIKFGGGVEMNLRPEQIRPPPDADAVPASAPATLGPVQTVQTPVTTMQTSQRRGTIPP